MDGLQFDVTYWHLRRAGHVLSRGGVIIYPTEGVFGLGCCFDFPEAVARILRLKGRPESKGLIVVANSLADMEPFLDLRTVDRQYIEATWPGPVTWVFPVSRRAPRWVTGGRTGLAIRVSAHPCVQALTRLAGPLVSTSANPSGRPPARTLMRARGYFPRGVDYFVPGRLGGAVGPTEVRDAVSHRTLRKAG